MEGLEQWLWESGKRFMGAGAIDGAQWTACDVLVVSVNSSS